ncbi:hypothetical protein DY218_33825 [Streptomyces triticagri]|uniref:Uncharacterized protein n=1 Tax=Streptomyces triticagri TaxID=2293568 RepID=A0A372LWE0_9ACTN|nr:hypothetical protein [Streptomyces triticagri]RFU82337.1 hypothetical protein DY218_33825 [Streptomyces triticagri]
MHQEFLCQVTAYGMCDGRWVGVPLGSYRAPSLSLALWWMRERATWMAERLDPVPERCRWPERALVPVADDVPDAPGELRAWRDDRPGQDAAGEQLARGLLVRFATRDDTTVYELLAESVDALRMQRAALNDVPPLGAPA